MDYRLYLGSHHCNILLHEPGTKGDDQFTAKYNAACLDSRIYGQDPTSTSTIHVLEARSQQRRGRAETQASIRRYAERLILHKVPESTKKKVAQPEQPVMPREATDTAKKCILYSYSVTRSQPQRRKPNHESWPLRH